MTTKGRVTLPQAQVHYVQPYMFQIREKHDGSYAVVRYELTRPISGKLDASTVEAAKILARSIADSGGRARVVEWSGAERRWVKRAEFSTSRYTTPEGRV